MGSITLPFLPMTPPEMKVSYHLPCRFICSCHSLQRSLSPLPKVERETEQSSRFQRESIVGRSVPMNFLLRRPSHYRHKRQQAQSLTAGMEEAVVEQAPVRSPPLTWSQLSSM